MSLSTAKMTAEQFFQLGEDPPGIRLELVAGEVVVSPTPSWGHQQVVFHLNVIVGQYIRTNRLGKLYSDTDTAFGEQTVRRPDLSFYPPDRKPVHHHALPGNPELCVEIVSPSSAKSDRGERMDFYRTEGVPNYWIVDHAAKCFEAYRLVNGDYQLVASGRDNDVIHAPPFEDLAIPLVEVWPEE